MTLASVITDPRALAEFEAWKGQKCTCLDCQAEITAAAERCRSCSLRYRRKSGYATVLADRQRRARIAFDYFDAESRTRPLTNLESLYLEASMLALEGLPTPYKLQKEIAQAGGKPAFKGAHPVTAGGSISL